MKKNSKKKLFTIIGVVVGFVGILIAVLLTVYRAPLQQAVLNRQVYNFGVRKFGVFDGHHDWDCGLVPFSIAARVDRFDSNSPVCLHDDCLGRPTLTDSYSYDGEALEDLYLVCRFAVGHESFYGHPQIEDWQDWRVISNDDSPAVELQRLIDQALWGPWEWHGDPSWFDRVWFFDLLT